MTIETKKVASVNEAISIINRLNYTNETFHYNNSTYSNDYKVEYRFCDGVCDNDLYSGMSIIEIVVDGTLQTVRFFNHFCDIAVDLRIGDSMPDYERFDNVIDADADAVDTENANVENLTQNGETPDEADKVCAICGEPIEGEFALAHALDGRLVPVCATCLENNVTTIPRHGERLIKCASCGELFVADPNAPDPDVGRQVFDEEQCQWVPDLDAPFDDEQGAWRPDIQAWVCNNCIADHHVRCSVCKCWTHVDDCMHNDDGQVICRSCAESCPELVYA